MPGHRARNSGVARRPWSVMNVGRILNWTLPRRRNQCLRYKVYLSESNATVLLSTVLSIVTLGTAIAITE
jgi:hypothetical protein